MADTQERALNHVRRCDAIFDGRGGAGGDREFAYQQMRVLALELLELLALARQEAAEEPGDDTTASA